MTNHEVENMHSAYQAAFVLCSLNKGHTKPHFQNVTDSPNTLPLVRALVFSFLHKADCPIGVASLVPTSLLAKEAMGTALSKSLRQDWKEMSFPFFTQKALIQ